MVGGTTSGYSLMGKRHMAINPTRKITIESTPAKMGRRMKKWEKFIVLSPKGGTKSEPRRPKAERSPKPETRSPNPAAVAQQSRRDAFSAFRFRPSFGLR